MPSQGRTSISRHSTGRQGSLSHSRLQDYDHGYTPVHGNPHHITHQPTHGITYAAPHHGITHAAPLDHHHHRVSSPYHGGHHQPSVSYGGHHGGLNTSHHYPVNHHNVTRRIVISPGGTRREEGGDGHDYQPHGVHHGGHHNLNLSRHASPRRGSITREYATDRPRSHHRGGKTLGRGGDIKLTIESAKFAKDADVVGKQDPFIRFTYKGKREQTRALQGAGKKAKWDQVFTLADVGSATGDLRLEAVDEDTLADDWIGATDRLPYSDLLENPGRPQKRKLALRDKSGKEVGQLKFTTVYNGAGAINEDDTHQYERTVYETRYDHQPSYERRDISYDHGHHGRLNSSRVHHHHSPRVIRDDHHHHHQSPRVIRADDHHHHHSPVVHHRQSVTHHVQPDHHREPRHSISHSPNRSVIHPSSRPSIHAQQPISHHQPIVHHQSISHHQPITHHQPIAHHQPVVHHQPITHHQPIAHHQSVVHHQPIAHHQPVVHHQPIAHHQPIHVNPSYPIHDNQPRPVHHSTTPSYPIHDNQPRPVHHSTTPAYPTHANQSRRSISPAPVHSGQPTVRPHPNDGTRPPTSHTQPVYNNRAPPVHDNRAPLVHDNRAPLVHDNRVPVTRNGPPVTRLQ